MKKDDESAIDPAHAAKRSRLSTVGLVLVGLGAPCALIGLILFLSFFISVASSFGPGGPPDMGPTILRAIIGFVMLPAGAFMAMIGLKMLVFGHAGKILRYQAGEAFPVARDVAQHSAPVMGEVAREVSRSVREGWEQGESTRDDAKVRHDCGTWNDPADSFCKGCGQSLVGRTCPSCLAPNDGDAHYCEKCGAKLDE